MDEKDLRTALLAAQYQLKDRQQRAVLVLVNGVEAAGKGETVKKLSEWMDSRHLQVESFASPSRTERQFPSYWRFWRRLPAKGRIALFFGNWYSGLLEARVHRQLTRKQLGKRIDEARRFEQLLANEGIVLVKLWFSLSEEQLHVRLKELASNPVLRWQVTKTLAWKRPKVYQRYSAAAQQLWQAQDDAPARWHLIDGWDADARDRCAGQILLGALQTALTEPVPPVQVEPPPAPTPPLLATLDLSPRLSRDDYDRRLPELQARFAGYFRSEAFDRRALVLVFEGMDAAGKGGAIRRITAALDPREYHVMQVSAPTPEERLMPYLHRFWLRLPERGQCTIYDRSWYGRVLVERVEGLIEPAVWTRAYDEINEFERSLTRAGVIVVKFWLAVDQETQLHRFKERESTPFKQFKITADDWRNRERWDDYITAASEAIERTDTRDHPWVIVPANDKYHARVRILETLNKVLENSLDR